MTVETPTLSGLSFSFDAVLTGGASQERVYDETSRAIVSNVLDGYHGTVLCYGMSGAGKTFTMCGPEGRQGGRVVASRDTGIISRAAHQIFEHLRSAGDAHSCTIRVSYVEVYQERIRCLLSKGGQPPTDLDVRIHPRTGVSVAGCSEVEVTSEAELLRVAAEGSKARFVSATGLNDQSSRSHACMMISIERQQRLNTGSPGVPARYGKLFLVDLAGSEAVSKSGAEGARLDEAKKINLGLSALGLVIRALTDRQATHVPYRDSKLTRLLQDSLGGSAQACLILACSPSALNALETINTLKFGTRAKGVENKVKPHLSSAGVSEGVLQRRIRELEETVVALSEGCSVPGESVLPALLVGTSVVSWVIAESLQLWLAWA